ncbi:MAG: glycosyltransferase family 9 protein, partial [Candidatus Eiseniibacteriota bacterium]
AVRGSAVLGAAVREAAVRGTAPAPMPATAPVVRGDLPLLAALLRASVAAIGNDSGLTHLAVAVGVPAVVLYGATVPELGFPPPGRHRIVERLDLGCRPCSVHGGAHCPRGDHACMRGLEVERVLAALGDLVPELLDRGRGANRAGPEVTASAGTRDGAARSEGEHG